MLYHRRSVRPREIEIKRFGGDAGEVASHMRIWTNIPSLAQKLELDDFEYAIVEFSVEGDELLAQRGEAENQAPQHVRGHLFTHQHGTALDHGRAEGGVRERAPLCEERQFDCGDDQKPLASLEVSICEQFLKRGEGRAGGSLEAVKATGEELLSDVGSCRDMQALGDVRIEHVVAGDAGDMGVDEGTHKVRSPERSRPCRLASSEASGRG